MCVKVPLRHVWAICQMALYQAGQRPACLTYTKIFANMQGSQAAGSLHSSSSSGISTDMAGIINMQLHHVSGIERLRMQPQQLRDSFPHLNHRISPPSNPGSGALQHKRTIDS